MSWHPNRTYGRNLRAGAPVREHEQQIVEVDVVVAVDIGRAAGAVAPIGDECQQISRVDGTGAIDVAEAHRCTGNRQGDLEPVRRSGLEEPDSHRTIHRARPL